MIVWMRESEIISQAIPMMMAEVVPAAALITDLYYLVNGHGWSTNVRLSPGYFNCAPKKAEWAMAPHAAAAACDVPFVKTVAIITPGFVDVLGSIASTYIEPCTTRLFCVLT